MGLINIAVPGGIAVVDERTDTDNHTVLFCGRDHCPFYFGQMNLFRADDVMECALVGHTISSICQPYYIEIVKQESSKSIDSRLDEVIAFEARYTRLK